VNVRQGASFTKEINLHNVKVGEIGSWKSSLKVTAILPNGDRREATPLFKLNETLSGADRKQPKRLEELLIGHWRDDSANTPFESAGEYFFSSTTPEAVRVDSTGGRLRFSIDVLERNYAAGVMKLRLVSPRLGLQFDVAPTEEKVLRATLTDISRDGHGFEEVDNATRPKFTSEWKWIDRTERP
jgi:hypothetical protein